VSKYKAVYNDIKSKINDGILPPKQELPSESELMQEYGFSKDTIRRDFAILSESKLVQRTHGGILPLENKQQILSFNDRSKKFTKEKRKIAHPLLNR